MKLVKNTIVAIVLLTTMISCSNWLDVQPRTESRKDAMFKNQQGFREVLIGAYIRLKNSTLYGGDLTYGAVEFLAQHWEYTQSSTEDFLSHYQYKNTESKVDEIYWELYRAIADVNGILENIDARKDVFTEGDYELIKGEALAIRAYCHFNILQLFGPVPKNADGRKILNYVKTITNDVHPSYSFKEFIDLLIKDLDESEALLKAVDPICKYSIYDLNHLSLGEYTPKDDFWPYRQNRMNYYTVLGEKARVYHWAGKNDLAFEYAMKVITAVDQKGKQMFPLGTSSTIVAGDYTLSSEHISNIYVYNLKEKTANDFSNIGKYYINKDKMFEYVDGEGSTDMRRRLWYASEKSGEKNYLIKKYEQKITMYEPSNVIPLMRISEMYLIILEIKPAIEVWEHYAAYFMSREIEPMPRTEEERKKMILDQYHYEFYAEGKLFYAYKRMATPSSQIIWRPFSAEKSVNQMYVLPLPKREIILK